MSTNTVKSHSKALYRKLGVGSRAKAVEEARSPGPAPGAVTAATCVTAGHCRPVMLPHVVGRALEVRIGITTATAVVRLDVLPGSGEGFLVGDAVNAAARQQKLAPALGGHRRREDPSAHHPQHRLY